MKMKGKSITIFIIATRKETSQRRHLTLRWDDAPKSKTNEINRIGIVRLFIKSSVPQWIIMIEKNIA